MKPPRNRRLNMIRDRVSRYSTRLGLACRGCGRSIDPDVAELVADRLEHLGCKPGTIQQHTPVCRDCVGRIVDHATAIREGRAS